MSRDALVVGVNTYQYLPSLKAPSRDAEAIAQRLYTNGEFRVHRLPEVIQDGKPQIGQKTQVTLRELETALINLFKPKGSSVAQTAIFYFSGHGIQRDAGIQEGYLALSDSNPDQGFYGLSLFWLRRLLQESPVRQRIILLDCCHSGAFLNFLEADPGAHPGTDRLFMAASREFETAYESLDSQYSVFTEALVTGLDPNRLESGMVTNHALTDWVNHSLKGEIQQPLFESSGSEIILTRCHGDRSATVQLNAAQAAKDICPYRGLEFFDESHAEYFFGREQLVGQLLQKLRQEPFVAVTGASGSGKSSLIRAGLIAQLRQGKKVPNSDQWKVKLITPTDHPLKSLAAAFLKPDLSDLERAEQLRRAETFLQDGGAGLAQLVRASLPESAGSTSLLPQQRPRFLLIIDQFEEVFTLSQGAQAERERQEFFDCLVGALDSVKELLSIVIVLRSDFLGKCSFYEGLAQEVFQHQVMVSPLKYEQIKATIMQPAQKVGLVCEPNLVYTMMMDVIGSPGELPLLQYTLLELWRKRRVGIEGGVARLTLDAYQELGGVRGTLQKRATEVFQSLSAEEQGIAKRVFLSLTQLGEGTEDTRRRVAKSELVSPAFPQVLVEQVLEKLVAAKLIIISQENTSCVQSMPTDRAEPNHSLMDSASSDRRTAATAATLVRTLQTSCMAEIVDVAHEALIRNWSLLRGWLEENREMLRRQRRIEQAAHEWNQAGQPLSGDYLLYGLRLRDAEDFLKLHAPELSALAQQYISVSCAECLRTRRASRRLRLMIPSLLVATLTVVLSQYYGVVRTQTEQKDQLQQATARERAAIAQAVVQDTNADPMTALLISRLAVESDRTNHEAQSSLRAALQNLRLQSAIKGHEDGVQQMVFSPDYQYLATAGAEGKIRLWTMSPKTIYSQLLRAEKTLAWSEDEQSTPGSVIQSIVFSPTGKTLAATGKQSSSIKLWSVETGQLLHQINGSSIVKQVVFSPNGEWIVGLGDDLTMSIWHAATGELKAKWPSNGAINSLEFSPNGQFLLTAGEDGTAQLSQIQANPDGSVGLKSVKTLTHPDVVVQANFSTHGQWIVTLCKDGNVRLWDSQTGQLQRQLTAGAQAATPTNLPVAQSALSSQPAVDQPEHWRPMKRFVMAEDDRSIATVDANQQVWVWDVESGQLQTQFDHPTVQFHEGQSTHASSLDLLQFSPNSQMVISTDSQPNPHSGLYNAYLWNRLTGQQLGSLSGHQKPITGVQFSPDGTYIVTASLDGTMRLWNATLGGELPSIQLNGTSTAMTFLPSQVLSHPSSSSESLAQAKKVALSASIHPIGHQGGMGAVQDADSQTLLDLVIPTQLQNWLNWKLTQPHSIGVANPVPNNSTETPDDLGTAALNPDLTNLVNHVMLVSAEGKLQRWQILTDATGTASVPAISQSHVNAFSPESASTLQAQLLTFTQTQLRQWNHQTRQPVMVGFDRLSYLLHSPEAATAAALPWQDSLKMHQADAVLSSVVASPDGRWLATADIAGKVTVYQIQSDQSLKLAYQSQNWRSSTDGQGPISQTMDSVQQPAGEPIAIRRLVFSPDSQQLLGIADDLTMRTWQTQTGHLRQVFRGHAATIHQAKFSPDGQWIISAGWDKTARIWQAATGRMVKVLLHQEAVSSVALSANGDRAITASWNGIAQVWQVSSGKALFSLEGHQKAILDMEFSPDGRQLVTASADGTARLWEAATGEEQATLTAPAAMGSPATDAADQTQAQAIDRAFFSPDGQYIATLTQGGQLNFWAATQEMLLKLASERTVRQLTPQECRRYLKLADNQCPQLN